MAKVLHCGVRCAARSVEWRGPGRRRGAASGDPLHFMGGMSSMNHHHRLAAALAALLSLSVAPAMAQSDRNAAQMDSESVTAEASPGASGKAQFQTVANPLLVASLALPDAADLRLLAERRR